MGQKIAGLVAGFAFLIMGTWLLTLIPFSASVMVLGTVPFLSGASVQSATETQPKLGARPSRRCRDHLSVAPRTD